MHKQLVIVGAGAAGIGAAKAAQRLGLDYVQLEASHRVGGRAYTETPAPGIHFDLGCHWLHTASRNPLTQLPSRYGMTVSGWDSFAGVFHNDRWLSTQAAKAFEAGAYANMEKLAAEGLDLPAVEAYGRDSPWAKLLDYWVSLLFSTDPDQVSLHDFVDFEDTGEGEDWPVKDGMGTMIARFAEGLPVSLNCPVREIVSDGPRIVVRSAAGDIETEAVLLTVSTGVLNAGDIRFTPALPQWKQEAIGNLPLGNHNRICLIYDRNVFGDYDVDNATWLGDTDTPMYFETRPFGLNYVVGSTGGRFADWLERAGQDAAVDYAREKLVHMFGADAGRHIVKTVVTAWRGDPWVRGAYSATAPGAHGARRLLGRPVDDRIYFAGEATSLNFMDTAHGAYISGVREVLNVAAAANLPLLSQGAEELAWTLSGGEATAGDQSPEPGCLGSPSSMRSHSMRLSSKI